MKEEDFKFANTEDSNITPGYGGYGKSGFDKASQVDEAVRDCRNKRAKEMVSGYETTKVDKFGNVLKVVVPDARKEYISSVKALKCILAPEIRNEKSQGYAEAEEEIEKLKEKSFNKYAYQPYIAYKNPEGTKRLAIDTKEPKTMPSIGSSVILPVSPTSSMVERVEGGWDARSSQYVDELIEIYDKLFEELNCLIERTGYFKKKPKTV